MSKLSEIFNREIDLIKKDENTLGIVLLGSSKDLDFEKDRSFYIYKRAR